MGLDGECGVIRMWWVGLTGTISKPTPWFAPLMGTIGLFLRMQETTWRDESWISANVGSGTDDSTSKSRLGADYRDSAGTYSEICQICKDVTLIIDGFNGHSE